MKKTEAIKNFLKENKIYVLAAVTLVLTAIAIGMVYSKSMSILKGTITTFPTTELVRQNQTGESDPRESTSKVEASAAATEKPTQRISEKETTLKVTSTSEAEQSKSYIMPCDGDIVRPYSPEIPLFSATMEDWRTHSGVDIKVKAGGEVLSVGDGKVVKAYNDPTYGYTVEIDCGEFIARYCGLDQESAVGIEQILSKGDAVGNVGTVPCEEQDEPHLHFEVLKNDMNVDPIKALE